MSLNSAIDLGLIYFVPLVLTLLIELPVVAMLGGERGSMLVWKTGLFTNTFTNPIAVFTILIIRSPVVEDSLDTMAMVNIAIVEAAVIWAEWRIFKWILKWSNHKALKISLIANGLSFSIGLLLNSEIQKLLSSI